MHLPVDVEDVMGLDPGHGDGSLLSRICQSVLLSISAPEAVMRLIPQPGGSGASSGLRPSSLTLAGHEKF